MLSKAKSRSRKLSGCGAYMFDNEFVFENK